jgi:hypothetical protein
MIDEDLKQKMQRLAREAAEKDAALRNAQQEAELSIKQLDAQIEELSDWQDKLIIQKQEFLRLLGRPEPVQRERRQARGSLIAAYTEALEASTTGLTSTEIVDWLDKNKPDLKTTSIPAVLSRGVDDGRLLRDERGRYRLAY